MPSILTLAELQRWPKAELHCHLDGSLRLTTLLELRREVGLGTSLASLSDDIHLGRVCGDLPTYLRAFSVTVQVMQSAPALERCAFELGVDAAAEGVIHLEVRFAPQLHTERGLTENDVIDAVARGLARARAATSISMGIIVCALRHAAPHDALQAVRLALSRRDVVVGFDLAGDEAVPPQLFQEAFALAHAAGLPVTVHAGEAGPAVHVEHARDALHATRIGHGTRAVEDGGVLQTLAREAVTIEACISSNVQTGVVSSVAAHPLRQMIAAGCRVTLATDNRLVSRTTLTRELWLAHTGLLLSGAELAQVVLHGFSAAFVDDACRAQLLARARLALGAWLT